MPYKVNADPRRALADPSEQCLNCTIWTMHEMQQHEDQAETAFSHCMKELKGMRLESNHWTGLMIPQLGASGGVTGVGVCARKDKYDIAPKADCCGAQPPQAAKSCYADTDSNTLGPALHAALIRHCAIWQTRDGHALCKQSDIMLTLHMRSKYRMLLLLRTTLLSAAVVS